MFFLGTTILFLVFKKSKTIRREVSIGCQDSYLPLVLCRMRHYWYWKWPPLPPLTAPRSGLQRGFFPCDVKAASKSNIFVNWTEELLLWSRQFKTKLFNSVYMSILGRIKTICKRFIPWLLWFSHYCTEKSRLTKPVKEQIIYS